VTNINNRYPILPKEELNEIQTFLLELAEELLVKKKKRNLYPLELLEAAKERSNYPESELFQNIMELYKAKWIVPGESLLKKQVLNTLRHRDIYYYIIENPGCDTLNIMRDLNISFRYALRNLETLFIFGFIRARKYSQYFLYFPYFMKEEEDMLYCVTRNKTVREILRFLLEKKVPMNVYEIAQALNKKEITIQRKLPRLVQYQFISLVQVGMRSKYTINKLDNEKFRKILKRYKEL